MYVETVKCEGNQCLLFDYYEKIETSIEKVGHLKVCSYRRSRAASRVLWLYRIDFFAVLKLNRARTRLELVYNGRADYHQASYVYGLEEMLVSCTV